MTYSLVARDTETGALGVAVQSHFFAVGALVPWAEAGVGAVATQSFTEVAYGPGALELLRTGVSASDALHRLLAQDPLPDARQVGIVDAQGRAASHTGSSCIAAAGHHREEGLSTQANMMRQGTVCAAMAAEYRRAGPAFSDRLLAALHAAEAEGGDIRGRQSAAMLIVAGQPTARSWDGVLLDVRVDDDPDPLAELARLVARHNAYERLGQALFRAGAVIGEYRLSEAELDRTLAELERAQEALPDNPEPDFWRAVVLARGGRLVQAREALEEAARVNPDLREFIRRLPDAGLLSAAAMTAFE